MAHFGKTFAAVVLLLLLSTPLKPAFAGPFFRIDESIDEKLQSLVSVDIVNNKETLITPDASVLSEKYVYKVARPCRESGRH
jgi:hypothetical protein